MEYINSILEVLPLIFGNLTMIGIFLAVVYILLTGLTEIGIRLVRFTIAADDDNAPKININNIFMRFLTKILWSEVNLRDVIVEREGYWLVKKFSTSNEYDEDIWYLTVDNKDYWKEHSISTHHKTYESAARSAREYHKASLSFKVLGKTLASLFITDFVLYCLGLNFLLTATIVCVTSLIFSIRWIAKKLYANMKKTNNHEERITTLEGEANE